MGNDRKQWHFCEDFESSALRHWKVIQLGEEQVLFPNRTSPEFDNYYPTHGTVTTNKIGKEGDKEIPTWSPGFVRKISSRVCCFAYDLAIKEPCVPEIVCNNDILKNGTGAERNTNLLPYAQKTPLPYKKLTKNIRQHIQEQKKKFRGEAKIGHRQADNTSGDRSTNLKIPKSISSRKPSNPRSIGNWPNFTPLLYEPLTSAILSISTGKTEKRAPEIYG